MNLKGNILFPILLFGSITIAITSEMIGGAAIPAYTPSEVCDEQDLEACAQLAAAYARTL